MCARDGFCNLKARVPPAVDPSLSTEPDPLCPSCAFSKARRQSHKTHTGHISSGHAMLNLATVSVPMVSSQEHYVAHSLQKGQHPSFGTIMSHFGRITHLLLYTSLSIPLKQPQN
jgi:hypothetical protein